MKNSTDVAALKCWIGKSIAIFAVALSSMTGFCQPSGTVVGWGGNSQGETTIPSQLTNVVAIAAGNYTALALTSNGTLVAWGNNAAGQFNIPSGLSNVLAIAVGEYHCLALTTNGTVVGWGDNSRGETTIPSQLTNVVAISAGGYQSLALTASGTVVSWGDNSAGQRNVPAGLTNAAAISAGDYFDLALTKNGKVVGWGDDTYGQTNIPAGLSNVVSIAAGWSDGYGASWGVAATSAGNVVTWGGDSHGQTNVPAGLSNVVTVATGWYHNLALTSGGSVVAWGGNQLGQTNVPVGLNNVVAIAGGNSSSLALIGPPNIQITSQLTNSDVLYGQNVTLGISASSQKPLSYQWYFVPANNSGQAGAYAELLDLFVYGAVVTNGGFGYGNIPGINFEGGGGSGAGGFATVSNGVLTGITVTNAGYGYTNPPAVAIDPPDGFFYGQTNSTLTISNADQNSAGTYYVVVSNSSGSVTSSVVNLTVLYPPSITSQPQDEVVTADSTALFDAGVTGTGPLTYQWFFQGTNLLDTDASTLIITNVTPPNLGTYTLIVTNDYGSVTSSIANLFMYPYLETPFAGAISYWGQTNILTVGVWGSGNLAYQWYFNGTAIPDATSSNLILSGIQFTNAGLYSVVVSSAYGSVTNTPEQVVVNPANVSLGLFAGVTIQGTAGYSYQIQSSSDLSNPNVWVTLTNIILTAPIEIWDDNSADVHAGPRKFYRILPAQ